MRLHGRPDIVVCYRCLDWLNARRARFVVASAGGVRIVNTDPCFAVADVARAVDHYQRLGFDVSHHDETSASAHRNGLTVHLALADDPDRVGKGAIYLHVDDAQELADEWRKAGVEVIGPEDDQHRTRQGSHVDPDGNLIRFGSPVPGPPRA
ncbi:MAG TPA: VOC family protein [Acidimicrobiales bacterium]|nr:VOC family protein [Acidimicrobiales bacterium]